MLTDYGHLRAIFNAPEVSVKPVAIHDSLSG